MKCSKSVLLGCILVLFSTSTWAKKAPVRPDKRLVIEFSNPEWNVSPTEIDSQLVFLKHKRSTGGVTVNLQETAENSGVFVGNYVLNFGTTKTFQPDIFVPTEKFDSSARPTPQFKTLLESGQMVRKPFIYQRNKNGTQQITIYSNRDEVASALTKKKAERSDKAALAAAAAGGGTGVVGKAASQLMSAEQIKEFEAGNQKMLEAQTKREAERQELSAIERAKQEKRLQQQAQLAEAERAKRVSTAGLYAKEGLAQYQTSKFAEAEVNFKKAVEYDPSNTGYYYQYGVTLYRLGRFNDSIVILRNASGAGFDPLERDFYVALNHYQLKEYPLAAREFERIRATKDPRYGASGSFYLGLINFDGTRYERAKQSFQEVLDTSSDPKLDERAEEMMEKIDRVLEFAKLRSTKFFVNLTMGVQYDSNILLTADSAPSQASPSDIGDNRFSTGGSVYWRPIFDEKYEFGLKAKGDLMYTFRSQFAQADPMIYNITAPLVVKNKVFNKNLRTDVKPGYEVLSLDTTNTGTKKTFMTSLLLDVNNSFVMQDNWISAYNVKYRKDTFPDAPTQNANKYTLNLNNIYFLDQKKTTGIIGDLGYTVNSADGPAFYFNRYDIGANYLTPIPFGINLVSGLSYFQATYANDPTGRVDQNYTFNLVASRPLLPWLSVNVMGNYIINGSNIASRQYKKYVIGFLLAVDQKF